MKNKENKNVMNNLISVVLILSIITIFYLAYLMLNKEEVAYSSSLPEESNIIESKPIELASINFNQIIENNTKNIKKEEIIKQEIDLEYITKYSNNEDLPQGILQVVQEGRDGKQEIIIKKTYEGDKLIKEEQTGNVVTKMAINKLVEVGTGKYFSNYKVKVGDTLYVTADYLSVRIQPQEEAEKLITLNKNTKVKLLQKDNEWYKIQYQSYSGWAKGECFTYINPNSSKEEQEENGSQSQYTKAQLLSKLSFNMDLNKPSGLSLEQFKKIFSNDSKDKKNIFQNNAQYFYYAEKQYNVNGVFVAAVAIHESGWGGSSIASNKNNLFGYGAYDRDPYNSAYSFNDYSEGIDLLARVFAKYYLNPAGTKIYNGNIADGCYYNGATLSGVNKKYATDKNWANGVYYWMKYLYNRL